MSGAEGVEVGKPVGKREGERCGEEKDDPHMGNWWGWGGSGTGGVERGGREEWVGWGGDG